MLKVLQPLVALLRHGHDDGEAAIEGADQHHVALRPTPDTRPAGRDTQPDHPPDGAAQVKVALPKKPLPVATLQAWRTFNRADGTTQRFSAPRIATQNTHGTGCTLSSAIATRLAQGAPLSEAVADAKAYLTQALRHAGDLAVGHGHGPVHHGWKQISAG